MKLFKQLLPLVLAGLVIILVVAIIALVMPWIFNLFFKYGDWVGTFFN